MSPNMLSSSWLARRLVVCESTDPTLIGLEGQVIEETRNTILLACGDGLERRLAKNVIHFTLDGNPIAGPEVILRVDERIRKNVRRR